LADLQQFGGAGVELLREQTVARIAELERQIATEKERAVATAEREAEQRAKAAQSAAQSLESAIEQRDFSALSPEQQRAKIEADTAALIAGAESGAISPADAAARALELQRRQDELNTVAGGFAGSAGASAFQRIGFATNEFFDTRQKKDPAEATERATAIIREIFNILKKGEPLVLAPTSS
jgi:hypothetical protein